MSFTEKLIALCPPEVFYNDLDKQAIALCLTITRHVRRFKDNPCVPQDTRITLEEHFYDLADIFIRLQATQDILKDPGAHPDGYAFVIDTLRTILRHDLGESIFEPQSYIQKVDPRLPKIAAGYYEAFVTRYLYDMAQHAVATGKQRDFLDQITSLQKEYTSFDAESARLTGQAYGNYLYTTFDSTIDRLKTIHGQFPAVTDRGTLALIAKNNDRHEHDYAQIENPVIRQESAVGIYAKVIDTAQLEEIYYEREKLLNPELPYFSISRQFSHYAPMVSLRSEKFIPLFTQVAQGKDYLQPFLHHAYELAYTRSAAHALVLRPYTFLQHKPDEPGLFSPGSEHEDFNRQMQEKIAKRRETIHPLDDREILSNLEIAAKALVYRELKPPVQKSMFDDKLPMEGNFRKRYDEILDDLQSDRDVVQKKDRINRICNNRLAFYATGNE